MKLSEAMELAAISGQVERDENWGVCAIGISGKMAGIADEVEHTMFGCTFTLNERPMCYEKYWPWLEGVNPQTAHKYLWDISDKFEDLGWTVSKLSKYVALIEPECGECNRFECTCAKTGPAVEQACTQEEGR